MQRVLAHTAEGPVACRQSMLPKALLRAASALLKFLGCAGSLRC